MFIYFMALGNMYAMDTVVYQLFYLSIDKDVCCIVVFWIKPEKNESLLNQVKDCY